MNYNAPRTHFTPSSSKTPASHPPGKAGFQLLHLPFLHKLLHPSDSYVILHGEGDEGGGQVAGEGKAESVKLCRVENEKDLPGGGHHDGVVPLVGAFLTESCLDHIVLYS